LDLRETEWEGVDWMYLAQNLDQRRNLLYMITNFQVP